MREKSAASSTTELCGICELAIALATAREKTSMYRKPATRDGLKNDGIDNPLGVPAIGNPTQTQHLALI
jgi:hypothetical protein